jgi:hypothetical protein
VQVLHERDCTFAVFDHSSDIFVAFLAVSTWMKNNARFSEQPRLSGVSRLLRASRVGGSTVRMINTSPAG